MIPPTTSSDALALLPALVALLETESVTRAALQLGVGQPAMSRTLSRLRALTGDPLLVRTGRQATRTARGDILLPEAKAALQAASRAFAPPVAFVPASAKGTLALALGDDLSAMLVAPLLERLRREAPGIDLRVHALAAASVDAARRGTIDLVVCPDVGPEGGLPDISDFVRKPSYLRRFVTVTRATKRLSLEAFCAAEHILVSPRGDDQGYVDRALSSAGRRRRRVAVTVPSFQAALALVARTDLIATLPDDLIMALAPRLHTQRCPVATPELAMCMFWHARLTTDTRHRWLRTRIEDALSKARGVSTK